LTSYFSQTAPGALLLTDLLLMFIVLCQVSLSSKSSDSNISVYYLVFFLFCGIGPVLYYLILEFTKQSWWFLIAINPFWLFWQIKQQDIFYSVWLLQCLIWIGIIILVVLIRTIRLRLNKNELA
jgi:exosortase/archaeosortase